MYYWLVFNDLQGNSSSTYVFIANGFSIKMCLNREMKFKLLFSNLQKSNFWQRNCKSVLRIYCNTFTTKICRHDINTVNWPPSISTIFLTGNFVLCSYLFIYLQILFIFFISHIHIFDRTRYHHFRIRFFLCVTNKPNNNIDVLCRHAFDTSYLI